MQSAHSQGLDLVEVSVDKDGIAICKFLDYGKIKYEATKKEKEIKKKLNIPKKKEVQLSPTIAAYDLQHKIRLIEKFLKDGNIVRLVVKFKGREKTHLDLGLSILKKTVEQVSSISKIDEKPKREMNTIFMVLSPK